MRRFPSHKTFQTALILEVLRSTFEKVDSVTQRIEELINPCAVSYIYIRYRQGFKATIIETEKELFFILSLTQTTRAAHME